MSEPTDEMLKTLSVEQLERLKPFGAIVKAPIGTVLVEPGDREPDLIVVLEGAIEVLDIHPETKRETSVGIATPGTFMGELNVLSGETTFVRVRATVPSTVIRISGDALRRLMATDSDLGDLIFGVLVARFYPTPDAIYSIMFPMVVPQDTLAADATVLTVPEEPVFQYALLYAIRERGEDMGLTPARQEGKAARALDDAVEMDRQFNDGERIMPLVV